MDFDVNRENFEKIINSYKDYIKLYRLINNGSIEGITPFDEFYWRFSFTVRYQDSTEISTVAN